jgi:nucleotide-binding universal stress UspA family protein
VEVEGNFADQIVMAARLSDLVVFGQLKEADRPGLAEAFESTLIDTGKPVLLASQKVSPAFGERVAIAWNGSLAAAHAASAALPYLSKAKSIEILTVGRTNAEPIDASDLERYLRLHGLTATARKVDGTGRSVSDVLLEAAVAGGAGMLVAGGYGHNRLREMFVTGITRRVAARADIPCFLVH